MNPSLKRHDSIDFFRLIASLFVVFIHTGVFYSINPDFNAFFIHGVVRVAVPFFFMATGFFQHRMFDPQDPDAKTRFKSFLRQTLKIYLVWSVIYFSIDLLWLTYRTGNTADALKLYAWNLVFVNSHFHLWYFLALIWSSLIIRGLRRFLSLQWILALTALLYGLGLFGDSWYGLISNAQLKSWVDAYLYLFETTRNGLFFAPLLMGMGLWIAEHPSKLRLRHAFILTLLFYGLFLGEVYLLLFYTKPKEYNLYLLLVPTAYFLFVTLLNWRFPWKLNGAWIRDYSFNLYLIHPWIIFLIDQGNRHSKTNSPLRFVLVYLISGGLALGMVALKRRNSAMV